MPRGDEFTWRHIDEEALPAVAALIRTVEEHDRHDEVTTDERLRYDYRHDLADPVRDTVVAFAASGAPVALAWVSSNRGGTRKWRAILSLYVHPEHRSRALLDELMRRAERRCREILAALPGDLPRVIRTWTYLDTEPAQQLLERSGFSPARYFVRMRRSLALPVTMRPLPVDLCLVPWSEDRDDATRIAHNESFADHWGTEPQTPDLWRAHFIDSPNFRPDLSFLALAGDDVAGYALSGVYPEDAAVLGFTEAWTEALGVRPAWRRRGVASALLTASLEAFRAWGCEHGTLAVDADNLTGAVALYEGLGYVRQRVSLDWVKHV